LVPIVFVAAAGIIIDRWLSPCSTLVWGILALALGSCSLLMGRIAGVSKLALLAACATTAGGWHHFRWSDLAPDDLAWVVDETARPVWVRGFVTEARGTRHRKADFGFGDAADDRVSTRLVLEVTAVNDQSAWRAASGRSIVVIAGDRSDIRAGQAVEAAGQLATIARPSNPGEFDYRAFMQAQGIRLRLSIDAPSGMWSDPGTPNRALTCWVDSRRHQLRDWLFERLDRETAPLAAALLLGWREEIDPEVNDAFARTGTTHLLAVSGLQLQALAAALLIVCRIAGFPRRGSYLFVGCAMVAYALLVGLAPSVARSTLMTVTFCLGALARRLARPANTLSLAAAGTLVINPSYLFDVGCQLSFLAIGALIWLVPPACASVRHYFEIVRERILGPRSPLDELERILEPWWRSVPRRFGGTVVDGIVTSAVVWFVALPLVAYRFHLVSPIGILLNIPLVPISSFALLLGGSALAFSAVWGPLGGPLALAAALLLELTKSIVMWGVSQRWGYRFVVGPTWEWVLVFYVLLALACLAVSLAVGEYQAGRLRFSRYAWITLLAWFIPGWICSDPIGPGRGMEAEFLAVGHGLAVLVRAPDGQTLLYDCGRLGDPSIGRRVVAPALWERGVNRIDTVVLSHADQDHYDGLPDLLDRFAVGEVRITPGFASDDNPMAVQLVSELKSRKVPVRLIVAPESWETAGARFTVWHPAEAWHPEASDNARSVVLDIEFLGRHLLLTGDLEQLGLETLLATPEPDPAPEVILSPHHGGRSANPERLYRWARPRLVVVSQRPAASRSNDPLAFVESSEIPLLRTWREGAICMRWTENGIVPRSFLADGSISSPDRRSGSLPVDSGLAEEAGRARSSVGIRFAVACLGFGLGAIVFTVLAIIEFAAWVLVAPPRSITGRFPSAISADVAGYERGEAIEVRAPDGARLAGRWLPAAGGVATGRVALLLHGFAEASTALEARRAAALNRHGWNVAVLDSRAYGNSCGQYSSFGAYESDDIRAWLGSLTSRLAAVDPSLRFEPVLWGRSMGAAIAVRAAAAENRLAAVVLESPMVDLVASMSLVLRRRRIPFSKIMARLITRRAGKIAGVPIDWPRPLDSARSVTCPVLIVHGTDDTVVSIDEARLLADAFARAPRWLEVPEARHTDVVDKGGEALLDQIAEFLDQAASPRVAVNEGAGSG
jgi:competence protein ComEC